MRSLGVLQDLSALYSLKISFAKSSVEVLGQQINNLNNFAIQARDNLQEKMKLVKDDISLLTSFSALVDKAKSNYIPIRQRQLELEKHIATSGTEYPEQAQKLEIQKSAAVEALREEIRRFNLAIEGSDRNFVRRVFLTI